MASKNPIVNRVEHKSDSGKVYVVSQRQDGAWACSCPGWKFHSPRNDCRHITAVKRDLCGSVLEKIAFCSLLKIIRG